MTRLRITEYLDIDLVAEQWVCNRCGESLGSARSNYKAGCLVYDRDPREIYEPVVEGNVTFSPDPNYCRILEFYCPSCGVMFECEAMPPGHPITSDIELDLDSLKARHSQNN
ncbi:MAG: acetone carboxylase subunit gamma [Nitrososphaerales archaeon]